MSEHSDKSDGPETADSPRTEWVEPLRQQLSTIEQDLHGITEHVGECYRWLDDTGGKPAMHIEVCVYVKITDICWPLPSNQRLYANCWLQDECR